MQLKCYKQERGNVMQLKSYKKKEERGNVCVTYAIKEL